MTVVIHCLETREYVSTLLRTEGPLLRLRYDFRTHPSISNRYVTFFPIRYNGSGYRYWHVRHGFENRLIIRFVSNSNLIMRFAAWHRGVDRVGGGCSMLCEGRIRAEATRSVPVLLRAYGLQTGPGGRTLHRSRDRGVTSIKSGPNLAPSTTNSFNFRVI